MFFHVSNQSSGIARRSLLACLAAGIVAPLRAQNKWPNKVLRIVIPFVPGGPPDAVARLILPKLQENLGQTIVIDNRGGAGGNIGTQMVAKSPADGNTLLLTSTAFVINTQFPESNYNAQTDFLPVTITATQSHVIVVHPSLPVKTLAELINLARTNPMAFASPGSGTAPHLTAERFFNLVSKVNMTPIHYRGAGLAVGAVVAGEPKVGCMAIAGPLQNIKAGKLRALAVSSAHRLATLPDVPTLAELGFADILDSTWVGAFLPAGTPTSIQTRWYEAFSQVLALPEIQEKIQSFAFDIIADSPARTNEYLKNEIQLWGDVIRRTGIKIE